MTSSPTSAAPRAPRAVVPLALLLAAAPAPAAPPDVLHQLDASLQRVVARVSPAVVQVQVLGYAPAEGREGTVLARRRSLGSGLIVGADGYVVTNHHVVAGAQRIRVVLPAPPGASPSRAAVPGRGRQYEARVVGLHAETDLALLKIDAAGLPTLPLADGRAAQPGQLVFAVGSPEGLASTVTMGVVSSVARQTDVSGPMLFIQTDAPINPGNSGGPLVDADGAVVGVNTFILTQSGGSQGLGFAIPADLVRFVVDSLRRFGHVHRVELGIGAQEVTPQLAAGLGLRRDWGVVVGDVVPGGPAARGGLLPGDLVESVDGRPIDSFSAMAIALYLHPAGQPVRLRAWRGEAAVEAEIEGIEPGQPGDQLQALVSPEQSLVARLGILGVEIDARLAALAEGLRRPGGVVVAARMAGPSAVESGLQSGDVVHAVNQTPVATLDGLRAAVDALRPGEAAVLTIERQGKLRYLAFEME
jgi:serine protease Do